MISRGAVDLTVLASCYNEQENISLFFNNICQYLSPSELNPCFLDIRIGQTFAILAGTKKAKENLLVIMDVDLQFGASDIPLMFINISAGGDVVCGVSKYSLIKAFNVISEIGRLYFSFLYRKWARE